MDPKHQSYRSAQSQLQTEMQSIIMAPRSFLTTLFLAATVAYSHAFSASLFQEVPTLQKTAPSTLEGIDIELPNFDELFARIQQVSPLARNAITGYSLNTERGFRGIDDQDPPSLKWKTLYSSKKKRGLHKIEKIDNYQGQAAPILRFRSTLAGPCVGECFANFLMNYDYRKRWDTQISQVYEIYPIHDLDSANIAMGFGRYGDCSKLGIGYCQTKGLSRLVSAREQLTLCGIQDFTDGSCTIWGTEMAEWHDHLMPEGKRHTRSKSHLFSTTLTPTSDNSFDVEYVLQLEIGGKIPVWMTVPIVMDTVKTMFKTVDAYFAQGDGGELAMYLKEKEARDEDMGGRQSILMTP